MANRHFFPMRCNLKQLQLVHARIVFDADVGTSAGVDASEVCDVYNDGGFIQGVTRSAEGTFKIYLADKWYGFGGMSITRVKDADADVVCVSEDVNNTTAGSGYVEVAFQTAGTDADPDGETVEFNFFLHDSSDGFNGT